MSQLSRKLTSLAAITALVLSGWVSITHVHNHETSDASTEASISASSLHSGCACSHSLGNDSNPGQSAHHHGDAPNGPDSDHCSICRLIFECGVDFDFTIELEFDSYCHQLCADLEDDYSFEFVSLYLTRGPPVA